MSLTFYFAPMSTASISNAVITELGLECERIELSIRKGETRTPEFLAINPNGRVPVIVHDGTVIWESVAITLYLGETFGVEAGLYPPPGPRRGEAMKWITWSTVTLGGAAGRLAESTPDADGSVEPGSKDWVEPDERVRAVESKARADINVCLSILNDAMAGKPYLLGDFSLVDAHLFGFIWWLNLMSVDLGPFANVTAWLERCGKRPALSDSD